MNALIIFDGGRWLRIVDDVVGARGDAIADALPVGEGELVAAIVPARDIAVHEVNLGELSEPQARAAGPLAIADVSAVPAVSLHIATGPADADGQRSVVAIAATAVTQRLLTLADYGLDPDRLLAAPLLLPRPIEGFVRGDLGNECVVRGPGAAFADDPVLTPLLTAGHEVATLDRSALETALVAAVANPEVDLRQGPFAKRRRLAIDLLRIRRLAVMLLALGLITLAAQLVLIVRLNSTVARIEADNRALAASLLPPGSTVTDPALQVAARLTAVQGAGGGFSPLAAQVVAAVEGVPGSELGSLVFDGQGGLRATIRGSSATDLSAVEVRLNAAGLTVVPGETVASGARPYRDLTVRAR